ncbi:putative membrane-bound dolichyl-phosphate-mannose-protein mannosyltransferase [Cytobacillus purgationiresistens]|uniref:Membrane-bound dolichyl-phosphate-mannose-protein mannosyltransferase n=1 Tax=Cytobacillus purgationiresistens TaxID=863449 RepID=A0ABU0AH08_9BACI|nr:putative membrane-bound dolichyl-phosphate-mannose-protein mannosyltransferase [Cytobacillus purgationiresistens]
MRNLLIILVFLFLFAKVFDYEPLKTMFADLFNIFNPFLFLFGFIVLIFIFMPFFKKHKK